MNAKYSYHRRPLRLKHYDYSKAGFYFITICTQDRLHLFGEIVDGMMVLNDAGRMIEDWYDELENKFNHIKNYEMIIMPNHIHFIIEILEPVGADLCVCPDNPCVFPDMHENKMMNAQSQVMNARSQRADTQVRPYVGDIVQWYKTMTTNAYIKMVKNGICPPFNKRVWQRNYYEHIIRDTMDYERIAMYIINNPMTWEDDVLSKNTYPQNDA
jgi:REP element-mobilizing transposase RayT